MNDEDPSNAIISKSPLLSFKITFYTYVCKALKGSIHLFTMIVSTRLQSQKSETIHTNVPAQIINRDFYWHHEQNNKA